MNELSDAIYTALANNTNLTNLVSLRIYRDVAPQTATYPLVTFQMVAGGTVTETPTDAANPMYLVSAISDSSAAQAETLAGYIHTALHKVTLSVSGWTNIWTAVGTHLDTVQLPSSSGVPLWQAGRFVSFRLSK